jgi:hypothetical protein
MAFQKGRAKTGGRKKGVQNRATIRRNRILAQIERDARRMGQDPLLVSPLEVMRTVMCFRIAQRDYKGALEAAALAAPYVHPRLNATDVKVQHTLTSKSDAEVTAEIQALQLKLAIAHGPPQIDATAEPVEPPSVAE